MVGESLRIIPTILIDGVNVVKGRGFVNDRVVGNAYATAKLYGRRFIDELLILDVFARKQNRLVDLELAQTFAKELIVPFSIGGGIRSLGDALECINTGAEKVVLGSEVLQNLSLIEKIASVLGSQAIIVSVVFEKDSKSIFFPSSGTTQPVSLESSLKALEDSGCGELLIQSREHDGYMLGTNLSLLEQVVGATSIPIIAGSGFGNIKHISAAIDVGINAVSVGSMFLFSELTPVSVANSLFQLGYSVRTPHEESSYNMR